MTEASIGTVVIARSVGWLIGSVFAGFLLKRIDIHRMLVGALLVMITAHLLVPFLASFFALWALFLAIGVSGGLLEAGGNSVLIMTWREKVGPFLQFLNFAIGIGALLSPLIMAVLLTEESVEFSVIGTYLLEIDYSIHIVASFFSLFCFFGWFDDTSSFCFGLISESVLCSCRGRERRAGRRFQPSLSFHACVHVFVHSCDFRNRNFVIILPAHVYKGCI